MQAALHPADFQLLDVDENSTAILLQIAHMPDSLLCPFTTDPEHPFNSSGSHQRSLPPTVTHHHPSVWISRSPATASVNITIFDGFRINVQVPMGDWEDRRWDAEDVKRAALIGLGRQFLGYTKSGKSVPIDVVLELSDDDAQCDAAVDEYRKQEELQPTDRPSAPEPSTPAYTAEHGHSPCTPLSPYGLPTSPNSAVARQHATSAFHRRWAWPRKSWLPRRLRLPHVPRFCRWIRTLII